MKMNSYPFLFWTLFFIFFNLTFLRSLSRPLPPAPPSNITLFGDASVTSTAISLTKPLSSCPSTDSDQVTAGAAFISSRVEFLNPVTKHCASFLSRFTFSMTHSCSSGLAMAFVVTSKVAGKRFLGHSYVAVRFESAPDANVTHIGVFKHRIDIKNGGAEPALYVVLGLDLTRDVTAWIEYRSEEKAFRAWVGYSARIQPPIPAIELRVDLSNASEDLAHVGFIAERAGSSSYLVKNWRFKPFFTRLPSKIPESSWDNTDCVFCILQGSGHSTGILILIALLCVLLLALIASLVFLVVSKKKIAATPRRRVQMVSALAVDEFHRHI